MGGSGVAVVGRLGKRKKCIGWFCLWSLPDPPCCQTLP